MGKSIDDYKKDYADALARGDAAGMKAANDGANAIRVSQGKPVEVASGAIAQVKKQSAASSGGTSYTPASKPAATPTQTGGNNAWKSGKDDYGSTDYSVLLKQAMDSGASADKVQDLLTQRTQKVVSTPGLAQYATDSTYQAAMDYIRGQQQMPQNVEYDLSEYRAKAVAADTEAALARLKSAYSKSMAEYAAQEDKLPERYRAATNSAAAQSAMAKKAFDEQAAASGLNSGTSGQAALDASAVYQGNLSNLQQSRASDLAEIDRARAALKSQYEFAVAQAEAEGDSALANALYEELVRIQGIQREDKQIETEAQRYEREYADRMKAQEWERERQERLDAEARDQAEYERKATRAAYLAQAAGDFSGYAELWGFDQQTVDTMVENYAWQNQISRQQAARDLADWYAKYGDFTKVKELGVNPATTATQGYYTTKKPKVIVDEGHTIPVDDKGGLSPQNFSSLRQTIARYLSEGNEAAAKRLVEQNVDKMNENQASRLREMLG